ncbi:hypothetical protein DIPPA_18632 [Diplonema papillatum]|nr:hypothetical protein DIPPA_18632 [Diplonema papillatum]
MAVRKDKPSRRPSSWAKKPRVLVYDEYHLWPGIERELKRHSDASWPHYKTYRLKQLALEFDASGVYAPHPRLHQNPYLHVRVINVDLVTDMKAARADLEAWLSVTAGAEHLVLLTHPALLKEEEEAAPAAKDPGATTRSKFGFQLFTTKTPLEQAKAKLIDLEAKVKDKVKTRVFPLGALKDAQALLREIRLGVVHTFDVRLTSCSQTAKDLLREGRWTKEALKESQAGFASSSTPLSVATVLAANGSFTLGGSAASPPAAKDPKPGSQNLCPYIAAVDQRGMLLRQFGFSEDAYRTYHDLNETISQANDNPDILKTSFKDGGLKADYVPDTHRMTSLFTADAVKLNEIRDALASGSVSDEMDVRVFVFIMQVNCCFFKGTDGPRTILQVFTKVWLPNLVAMLSRRSLAADALAMLELALQMSFASMLISYERYRRDRDAHTAGKKQAAAAGGGAGAADANGHSRSHSNISGSLANNSISLSTHNNSGSNNNDSIVRAGADEEPGDDKDADEVKPAVSRVHLAADPAPLHRPENAESPSSSDEDDLSISLVRSSAMLCAQHRRKSAPQPLYTNTLDRKPFFSPSFSEASPYGFFNPSVSPELVSPGMTFDSPSPPPRPSSLCHLPSLPPPGPLSDPDQMLPPAQASSSSQQQQQRQQPQQPLLHSLMTTYSEAPEQNVTFSTVTSVTGTDDTPRESPAAGVGAGAGSSWVTAAKDSAGDPIPGALQGLQHEGESVHVTVSEATDVDLGERRSDGNMPGDAAAQQLGSRLLPQNLQSPTDNEGMHLRKLSFTSTASVTWSTTRTIPPLATKARTPELPQTAARRDQPMRRSSSMKASPTSPPSSGRDFLPQFSPAHASPTMLAAQRSVSASATNMFYLIRGRNHPSSDIPSLALDWSPDRPLPGSPPGGHADTYLDLNDTASPRTLRARVSPLVRPRSESALVGLKETFSASLHASPRAASRRSRYDDNTMNQSMSIAYAELVNMARLTFIRLGESFGYKLPRRITPDTVGALDDMDVSSLPLTPEVDESAPYKFKGIKSQANFENYYIALTFHAIICNERSARRHLKHGLEWDVAPCLAARGYLPTALMVLQQQAEYFLQLKWTNLAVAAKKNALTCLNAMQDSNPEYLLQWVTTAWCIIAETTSADEKQSLWNEAKAKLAGRAAARRPLSFSLDPLFAVDEITAAAAGRGARVEVSFRCAIPQRECIDFVVVSLAPKDCPENAFSVSCGPGEGLVVPGTEAESVTCVLLGHPFTAGTHFVSWLQISVCGILFTPNEPLTSKPDPPSPLAEDCDELAVGRRWSTFSPVRSGPPPPGPASVKNPQFDRLLVHGPKPSLRPLSEATPHASLVATAAAVELVIPKFEPIITISLSRGIQRRAPAIHKRCDERDDAARILAEIASCDEEAGLCGNPDDRASAKHEHQHHPHHGFGQRLRSQRHHRGAAHRPAAAATGGLPRGQAPASTFLGSPVSSCGDLPSLAEASEQKASEAPVPETSEASELKISEVPEPKTSQASEPKTSEVPEPKNIQTSESNTSEVPEPKTSQASEPNASPAAPEPQAAKTTEKQAAAGAPSLSPDADSPARAERQPPPAKGGEKAEAPDPHQPDAAAAAGNSPRTSVASDATGGVNPGDDRRRSSGAAGKGAGTELEVSQASFVDPAGGLPTQGSGDVFGKESVDGNLTERDSGIALTKRLDSKDFSQLIQNCFGTETALTETMLDDASGRAAAVRLAFDSDAAKLHGSGKHGETQPLTASASTAATDRPRDPPPSEHLYRDRLECVEVSAVLQEKLPCFSSPCDSPLSESCLALSEDDLVHSFSKASQAPFVHLVPVENMVSWLVLDLLSLTHPSPDDVTPYCTPEAADITVADEELKTCVIFPPCGAPLPSSRTADVLLQSTLLPNVFAVVPTTPAANQPGATWCFTVPLAPTTCNKQLRATLIHLLPAIKGCRPQMIGSVRLLPCQFTQPFACTCHTRRTDDSVAVQLTFENQLTDDVEIVRVRIPDVTGQYVVVRRPRLRNVVLQPDELAASACVVKDVATGHQPRKLSVEVHYRLSGTNEVNVFLPPPIQWVPPVTTCFAAQVQFGCGYREQITMAKAVKFNIVVSVDDKVDLLRPRIVWSAVSFVPGTWLLIGTGKKRVVFTHAARTVAYSVHCIPVSEGNLTLPHVKLVDVETDAEIPVRILQSQARILCVS